MIIMNKGKTENGLHPCTSYVYVISIITTVYVCTNSTVNKATEGRNTIKVQWHIIPVFNSAVKETSLVAGSIGSR